MTAALVLAAALAQVEPQHLPAPEPGIPLRVTRSYRVEHLEMTEVVRLARMACGVASRRVCDWSIRGREFELRAEDLVHYRFAAELKERDVAQQTFELLLLLADKSGERPADLPEHARQALDDLGQILPYTGFRLLDAAEVRSSGKASLKLERARGYRATIEFKGDPGSGEPLRVERFELVRRGEAGAGKAKEKEKDKVKEKEKERTVLSNSFSIEVGETVVVGASKLDGDDQALVVLITALKEPQGGKS